MEETALVDRAKAGDERAFEQIVETYEKRIYNYTLRMSGNPDDALDLCQEVFLRVYKGISLFQGQCSLSTWIYSIASNICIDFSRKKKFQLISLQTAEEEPHLPDTRYQPDQAYEKQELREAIVSGLSALNPQQREILILREIQGLSYQEICEILSLEIGTVKSRICRAREQLCSILRNKIPDFPSNQKKGR